MKIGLDTSFLDRPPSGIGAYVAALQRWLPRIAPEVDFVDVHPARDWALNRLGTRGARFAWEFGGAGVAARHQDVALLHMPMMAGPLVSRLPFVATVHDVIPFVMPEYRSSRAQRLNLAVGRRAVQRAAAVITPSQHAASDVAAVFDIPRDRIWVTYEAADERYVPQSDATVVDAVLVRLGVTKPYLFNIGGVDVRKNLPVLVRAFHAVLADLPTPVQLVIGGAPHSVNRTVFPPLAPLIHELGLDDHVVLTGRISEEDKIALMQGATAYVTPSLYEGFGLSVLEAMACGIPVIAASRTSLPEIVGDAGLLVEPRVDPVAHALHSVLCDDALRAKLAARGRERAQDFHWQKTAEQTLAVYRHVLSGTRRQY
jgi:glycosyltransferase involved in cell wall biosynthesis